MGIFGWRQSTRVKAPLPPPPPGPGPTGSPPFLLANSIGRAAATVVFDADALRPWIDSVDQHVARYGPYGKLFVLYVPINPPPAVWDYKCYKCHWYQEPRQCKVVRGDISPYGWCTLWVPPANYPAFSWPKELVKGDW